MERRARLLNLIWWKPLVCHMHASAFLAPGADLTAWAWPAEVAKAIVLYVDHGSLVLGGRDARATVENVLGGSGLLSLLPRCKC